MISSEWFELASQAVWKSGLCLGEWKRQLGSEAATGFTGAPVFAEMATVWRIPTLYVFMPFWSHAVLSTAPEKCEAKLPEWHQISKWENQSVSSRPHPSHPQATENHSQGAAVWHIVLHQSTGTAQTTPSLSPLFHSGASQIYTSWREYPSKEYSKLSDWLPSLLSSWGGFPYPNEEALIWSKPVTLTNKWVPFFGYV